MKKVILLLIFMSSLLTSMQTMQRPECAIKNNLVLNIYGTLIDDGSQYSGTPWFLSNKLFSVRDKYDDTYLAPAYFCQFLKYIVSKYSITFFYNGGSTHKGGTIKNVWEKVFGANKTDSAQLLFTYDDVRLEDDTMVHPLFGDDFWYSGWKKNISRVGELDKTILIDHIPDYVLKGQEYNLLKVQSSNFVAPLIEYSYATDKRTYFSTLDLDKRYNILAFYKLLYIIGVLDAAAEHQTGIIDGLRAIQFKNGLPSFSASLCDLAYYKRGYRILLDSAIREQQETILPLCAHSHGAWSVLPPEVRHIIVRYMIQLTQQSMSVFPEIEKHFYS